MSAVVEGVFLFAVSLAEQRWICYTVERLPPICELWCMEGSQGEECMRAIDDSSVKYAAVLRLLQIWKQLPESDLSRMLRQFYLITDDFREMEDQGLLIMTFVGDEYLINTTTLGRLWLEQYNSEGNSNVI
jgi:hypothetical protein